MLGNDELTTTVLDTVGVFTEVEVVVVEELNKLVEVEELVCVLARTGVGLASVVAGVGVAGVTGVTGVSWVVAGAGVGEGVGVGSIT